MLVKAAGETITAINAAAEVNKLLRLVLELPTPTTPKLLSLTVVPDYLC
jgi:hypothetical protein